MSSRILCALAALCIATSSIAATTTTHDNDFVYRWYTTQGAKASNFSTSYCDPHFSASPQSELTPELTSLVNSSVAARDTILNYLSAHSWQLSAFKNVSTQSFNAELTKHYETVAPIMNKLGTLKSINQPGLALVRNVAHDTSIAVAIFCFPADYEHYNNVRMKLVLTANAPFKTWRLLEFSGKVMGQEAYNWITSEEGHYLQGFLSEKQLAPFKAEQTQVSPQMKQWAGASVKARNDILENLSQHNWSEKLLRHLGTSSLRNSIRDMSPEKSQFFFNFVRGLGPLIQINHPGQARLIQIGDKDNAILKAIFYFPARFKNAKNTAVTMSLISVKPYDTWKLETVYVKLNDQFRI